MAWVELTEGQIESLLSIMESALYWNTDNPTLDSPYNVELQEALRKGLKSGNTKTQVKMRFENIIR